MYFSSIEIENVGPIDHVLLEFPVNEAGRPKPIVIVGENGSGKSILLAHLVNCLVVGKQEFFDDGDVEKGKVYKYRSPGYVKSGQHYSYSSVKFQSGVEVQECQLDSAKETFEKTLGYVPARRIWTQIPANETSAFQDTFGSNQYAMETLFKKQCCLYFPVNRFEEPAWLNIEHLKTKARYSDLKHISRYSNRSIVCTSPLRNNRDWLLDLLFDRQVFEGRTHQVDIPVAPGQAPVRVPMFAGYAGPSTDIYNAVLQVLRVILREGGNIRLGAGARKNRQIAVMKDEQLWVPNLFQLSTGEVQLLNLFLSIVRDFDLSDGEFGTLNDIKGIAVIDEIDSHLHASHQKEVLPELIASFPNVQFIITTHSPLFLIGMEQKFGSDQFCIFNMPNGEKVVSSDFSEFNAAYESFKETTKHREEIRSELERHAKPILLVEGDYDIRYLTKAAELLGKRGLLDRIQLKDGGGYGNLDKVWKGYDNALAEITPNKIVLLYDCDTNKQETVKGRVYKRVMPTVAENPVRSGIENLFSAESIGKVEEHNPRFIDIEEQVAKRVRGEITLSPMRKSVNKDEKGNMCVWLCNNGTIDDFEGFAAVFQIIEEVLGA